MLPSGHLLWPEGFIVSALLSPLTIRGLTLRNRVVVSPMCQYSSIDGFATDWHLVHLGSRAVGGAAVVMTEATAVLAEGRISPDDLGIYRDEHVEMLSRITSFITRQGSLPGIQLAHAGRKASTWRPWAARHGAVPVEQGGWQVVGPSPLAFSPDYPEVQALDAAGIAGVITGFETAARRALAAGFKVFEVHAAHGYLLHQFLSPLSNQRTDEYGDSLEHRMRLTIEVAEAVRRVIPDELGLFTRVSATDWAEDGWEVKQSVELAKRLREVGVDLIDVTTGGNIAGAKIPVGPDYQVPFAREIRRDAGIATGAVGLITDAVQAEAIIERGDADLVLLARQELRDPYWPMHAAEQLGDAVAWPAQYLRAAPAGTVARG